MSDPCPVCTPDVPPAEALYVACAGSARLADRLSSVLHRSATPHRITDGLVVVRARTPLERRTVAEILDTGLTEVEKRLVRVGHGRVAQFFGAPDLKTYLEVARSQWFDIALAQDSFTIYYQPIVDLRQARSVAFECLVRLEGERIISGGEIVDAAAIRNEMLQFDTYAREKAIRSASKQVRQDARLFINFFPSAIFDPEPCLKSTFRAIEETGFRPSDIVFEIVECDPFTDYGHTRRLCEFFRSQGFGYAIDDLGAGTNTLDLIQTLKPDYVKLDKSIVWNLDESRNQEVVRRAVALTAEHGGEIIAEGVETPEQALQIRGYGVYLMQGYCFGKPAPEMREGASRAVIRDLIRLAGAVTSSSAAVPGLEAVPVSSARTPSIRP
jgi:EAL domain-containing protein (putative c-di-GMP-specific phosphodiesterase class I)